MYFSKQYSLSLNTRFGGQSVTKSAPSDIVVPSPRVLKSNFLIGSDIGS